MQNTKEIKPEPVRVAPAPKQCTKCLCETHDGYPTTGGGHLKFFRCCDCYEQEVRRRARDDLSAFTAAKLERKETQLKS